MITRIGRSQFYSGHGTRPFRFRDDERAPGAGLVNPGLGREETPVSGVVDPAAKSATATRRPGSATPATEEREERLLENFGLGGGLFLRLALDLFLGLRRLCGLGLLARFLQNRFVHDERRIHPLNERNRGRIALARAEFYDPGIAAVAVG